MITDEMGMLRYFRINEVDVPFGVWFLFEAKPRPSLDEIHKVLADVDNSFGARVMEDGSLSHLENCPAIDHNLNPQLQSIIKSIDDQTFRIALWEGHPDYNGGQPIAIALEPDISYLTYPDHPHISSIGHVNNCFVPFSLCYTNNPSGLGNNPYEKIHTAVRHICIWLFRHQVWLATRKSGNPYWPGPGVDFIEEQQFYYFRNPDSLCRCRSGLVYHQCCLEKDFQNACLTDFSLIKFIDSNKKLNLELYRRSWHQSIRIPQFKCISKLKQLLV